MVIYLSMTEYPSVRAKRKRLAKAKGKAVVWVRNLMQTKEDHRFMRWSSWYVCAIIYFTATFCRR